MALKKIRILSAVSESGIVSYNISHPIGSLYATCSLEMLAINALLIDDEVTLENEKFRIISIQKKPHKRGSPRLVQLSGRSQADIFEFTTLDNSLIYMSIPGLKQDEITYNGFDSVSKACDQAPSLCEGEFFKGTIQKKKRADCFSAGAWTAHDVVKDMVKLTEIAEVDIQCMDYDISRADFKAGMSVVEAARGLFSMFDPFIYARAPGQSESVGSDAKPTLYIIPTSHPEPYDWPAGAKIDQNVKEDKKDKQVKMVIIEGGVEEDTSLPNPCPPQCEQPDPEVIVNAWMSDEETPYIDDQEYMDKTAWEKDE